MTSAGGTPQNPTFRSESQQSTSSEKHLTAKPSQRNFDQFLSEIDPESLLSDDLDEKQREQALKALEPKRVNRGFLASIPLQCKGSDCIFAWVCPLEQQGIAPVGSSCPIETVQIQEIFRAYCKELEVDMNSMVEISMVRELVDQEIQTMRKSNALSLEGFITNNVIGVNPKGEVMYRKELHPAVSLEDKLHKRKSELRKELLATREARAKHLEGEAKGQLADILTSFAHAQKKLEELKKIPEIIDVDPLEDEEDAPAQEN